MLRLGSATVCATVGLVLALAASGGAAAPTELFFTEYIEGSSNNKALEIYNGTGSTVNLATGSYDVQMFFNGNPAAGLTIALTGSVASGDVYVLAQSSASAPILAQADQTNGAGWFNGDDAVVLRKNGTVIDAIGQIGFDPGTEWGTGLTSTADNTLQRKASIQTGDTNGSDAFDPSIEWNGFATDTFSGLGSHAVFSASCGAPFAVEAGVAGSRQVSATDPTGTVTDISITNVTPTPAPGSITLSGLTPAPSVGGTATANVDVDAAVPTGTYSVLVTATNSDAATASCTLEVNVSAPVPIHDIQGAQHSSPSNGNTVLGVHGIVTARRSNGFWMQDPSPDANDATSEGIFVFTNLAPSVSVGDSLSVLGTVSEFRAGGSTSTNLTLTELTSPMIVTLSTGSQLPPATVIGTGGRIPPAAVIEDDATGSVETSGVFDPATDGIDFYESLEGMRVQVNDAAVVGPRQVFGSGAGENREIPVVGANASVLTPRGGVLLRATDANPERIILNDVVTGGPVLPFASVGDSFPGATVGVLDYSFGNFKLEVTSLPAVGTGGLTREVTAAATPGQLAVATFNVENLDPNDPQSKFDQLAGLIANNLRSPDLLSLEEVQDNNGATNDGTVDPSQTMAKLIAAIDAIGPTYGYAQIDPVDNQDGGEPGGNIRQVFLFRTDRGLSLVSAPGAGSTTANSVVAGPHLQYSPGRIDPTNTAFATSRKPLAAEFTFHGSRLFVIGNHFNSKGGDQPLFGRFQPPVLSSEAQRLQQAQVVNDFVDAILAADANANVIVLGDLNDFDFSNPLATLQGSPPVLTNLYSTVNANERYSYVFEGNSQALDHVLASSHLSAELDAFDPVHVNAEFADQASDHDPLVARFCADATAPTLTATASPSTLSPPNHKYRTVTVTTSASDDSGGTPTVTFVSATSNEPDNAPGGADGNTVDDVVKLTNTTFNLRAERDETRTGRIYTITYRATDACGNSTTASATVSVPVGS